MDAPKPPSLPPQADALRIGIALTTGDPFWVQVREAVKKRAQELSVDLVRLPRLPDALTGKRDHIYHAAMLDPHTAAELDMD